MSQSLIKRIKKLIEQDELTLKRRERHLVNKRMFLFKLLKKKGFTVAEIGRLFNLHHSTIIYGIKKHEELLKLNDVYLKKDTLMYREYLYEKITDYVKSDLKDDILKAKSLEEFIEIKLRVTLGGY